MKKLVIATALLCAVSAPPATAASRGGPRTFRIHFSVLTEHATNVYGNWRLTCWRGSALAARRGFFSGETPFREYLPQTLPYARRCELRVVAWNGTHPHGQRPVVYAWVDPV
jgi:hypothetical protein